MSKDTWLYALRTDPSPLFKEQLRARLRTDEPTGETVQGWPWRTLFAAAAIVLIAIVVSVPGVRAQVAEFVSLFRVVRIVAVPVDSHRLDQLKTEQLDIGAILGEHIAVLKDPGPPVKMASLADASTAAGMTLSVPEWLPEKTQLLETTVAGERVVRVTANSQRLQQVMDALGINDLTVPLGLHGQIVDLRVPPVAVVRYEHGQRRTRLIQARSPQIALPPNVNLQALGEIGLRILGLAPAEAKQFAQAIDWNSTLVVPVPPNASSFRQVNIGGHLGVMVQHKPRNGSQTYTVAWSTPERVFVLQSTETWDQVLAMADSVR